jgi:hypothetical protein
MAPPIVISALAGMTIGVTSCGSSHEGEAYQFECFEMSWAYQRQPTAHVHWVRRARIRLVGKQPMCKTAGGQAPSTFEGKEPVILSDNEGSAFRF